MALSFWLDLAMQSAAAMDVEGEFIGDCMQPHLRGGRLPASWQLPQTQEAAEEPCKGGRETPHLGEDVGQGAGVGQQVQLAQQVLQVVPGQDALDHVGAVQAVDAVDAEHAPLALGQPPALQEEAKALKVGPDLVPQQHQPAERGKAWC